MRINPYELLVQNPDSTFFLQAGNDNSEFGISAGDYIVADRQAPALGDKLVIATLEDGLRIMKLRRNGGAFLEVDGKSLEITGREHIFIWDVVKWVLRDL